MEDDLYEELRKKYVDKLQKSLSTEVGTESKTRQYEEFRKEYMPKKLSFYETLCNLSAKILPMAPDKKTGPKLQKAIETCHIQTTPGGVVSFSFIAPFTLILVGFILFLAIPMALGYAGSIFLLAYTAIVALALIIPLGKIPFFIASSWRLKASNQMVLCIFYIVTYMRHTSNLELAIDFAAEHLAAPLSIDMKKVIWNIETEKYYSLQESLESYLENWRHTNDEFIESMHLIESSLVESSENRRIDALEKSLSVMLDETYEKMLHYAHDLKGPLTTLHMLGIILPILGLVILPLMVSFMPSVRWYHLFVVYNLTLPLLVYFIGRDILSKRPTGYGGVNINEKQEQHSSKFHLSPIFLAIIVGSILFLIGITPLLLHVANPTFDIVVFGSDKSSELPCVFSFCAVDTDIKDQTVGARYWFNEYRQIVVDQNTQDTVTVGPFGLVATLLSLFLPLALGISVGLYYKLRSKNILKLRNRAKKLELEFASALFQLGNRLADGLPLEIAFSKVAVILPETVSGDFFQQVSVNITKLGLSVENAIFHEKYGALNKYPSDIIRSSMKVLVESSKKGPLIASQAIINVSNYIKQMHRVDERLKDLMADVISSMKSQITFLTPTIAAIVIGITSMITTILGKLGARLNRLTEATGGAGAAGMGTGTSILGSLSGGAVGTYFFQLVVGIYVVELIFILTLLVNGIENGSDKINAHAMLGENMIKSTLIYVSLAFIVILLFNIVAGNIVPT